MALNISEVRQLPALQQHKLILKDFHLNFTSIKGPKFKSIQPKELVIAELQRIGTVKLRYRTKIHTRANWNKVKKTKPKFLAFQECFACGSRATARHHVIWLKHGGRNQKNNIVGICFPCHALIHPWLLELSYDSLTLPPTRPQTKQPWKMY